MKKKMLTLAVVLSAAFLFLTAFKTRENSPLPVKAVKAGLFLQKGVTADQPTGTVEISEELFNAAVNGSLLKGERTGEHSYAARNVINQPGGDPHPWRDPCTNSIGDSFAQFNLWYTLNYPAMQAWANANCRPAMFAWGNDCLCVLGMVMPRGNCPIRYEHTQAAFE
jgi:hypothetical protein